LANHRSLSFESLEHRCLLAAGMLDPMFGISGKVVTDFGEVNASIRSVAVQSDGKIVVVGHVSDATFNDWAMSRYNADGTLDSTFGDGGKVISDFDGRYENAGGLALQNDGKIIVVGHTGGGDSDIDFALARYNAHGTLDSTFGEDGQVITDFGGLDDLIRSVALQSDGKIVVAGRSDNGSSDDFALARYNADGTLDTSFDGDGKLTSDFGGLKDRAQSVVVQSDGKIVVAGHSESGSDSKFALVRYNTDGTLDVTFGQDGKANLEFGGPWDVATDVALQNDGKIIVAGYTYFNTPGFAVARYNPDGTLDSSFDGDGKVTTRIGMTNDFAHGVVVQSNGKILVAGGAHFNASNWDFVLVQYNTNGTLDSTFDGDGKVTTNFPGFDYAYAMALQHDGRIIVAGSTDPNEDSNNSNFALARYEGDPISPPALAGDYNRSGTVDAADYVLWRNTRGAVVAGYSGADGDGDGTIDPDDYDLWRTNFGKTLPVAASTALAEPATLDAPLAAPLRYLDALASTVEQPGRRNFRPHSVSRNVDAFPGSRDQALLAWLAAKPAGAGRALMGADFSKLLREPADDEISIEAARALDSAFGSLQDTA
jgi:uncharacterized delta-60 repeat protein